MRKIKGFKLDIRPKEVQRLAKKAKLDLGSIGGPDALPGELAKAVRLLSPALLYGTFPRAEARDAKGLAPIPGVAFSLILATLGEGLAEERRGFEAAEPERARVWDFLARCALDEAVRFASSLIEQEALVENCNLSPLSPLSGSDTLDVALSKLDGSKIGVSLADEGLKPVDSAMASLSWIARSRARKAKA